MISYILKSFYNNFEKAGLVEGQQMSFELLEDGSLKTGKQHKEKNGLRWNYVTDKTGSSDLKKQLLRSMKSEKVILTMMKDNIEMYDVTNNKVYHAS